MDIAVKLIVGLGNPGPEYEHSRHNAGAYFVAEVAHKYNASLQTQDKFFGATARISIDGQDTRLLIPNTFMNLSGQAVGAMAGFYNIPAAEILVAHDELDLSPGISRLKKGGGHGGHNGLRDIIKALANNRDFARLRIGIGHPGHASDVVDYVLRRAPQNEQALIQASIDEALDALPLAVSGRWNAAMTKLHSN
ncbi:MAG: aminoacyl-tRNA hydrolase [Gammaproteobacteria bacterium]|nr:MAG: aminoacyl-tRNA hydrolase [Gammaproteobacteria bacterium]